MKKIDSSELAAVNLLEYSSFQVIDGEIIESILLDFSFISNECDILFKDLVFKKEIKIKTEKKQLIKITFDNCEFQDNIDLDLSNFNRNSIISFINSCKFIDAFNFHASTSSFAWLHFSKAIFYRDLDFVNLRTRYLHIIGPRIMNDSKKISINKCVFQHFKLISDASPQELLTNRYKPYAKANLEIRDSRVVKIDVFRMEIPQLYFHGVHLYEGDFEYMKFVNLSFLFCKASRFNFSNSEGDGSSRLIIAKNSFSNRVVLNKIIAADVFLEFDSCVKLKLLKLFSLSIKNFYFEYEFLKSRQDILLEISSIFYENADSSISKFLKAQARKDENRIDDLYYSSKELKSQLDFAKRSKKFGDLIILFFGWHSNRFNTNPWLGGLFVIYTSLVFFFFFELTLVKPLYYCGWEGWDSFCVASSKFIKTYFQFLSPLHDFQYIEKLKPSGVSYVIEAVSRIFIGYGIYQTIQAFRKYGKN